MRLLAWKRTRIRDHSGQKHYAALKNPGYVVIGRFTVATFRNDFIFSPTMKRADATGVPSALTFIKVSNSGRNDTFFPPMLIAITQVPVDTTLKGADLFKR